MSLKILKSGLELTPVTELEKKLSEFCHSQGLTVVIEWLDGQYWLHSDIENENPITIEIDRELERHEAYFKKSSVHKELLARAVGVKGSVRPQVFDLTAGLLGDTLLFLSFGCKVEAFERHPLTQVLIESAIQNAQHPLVKNLTFHSETFDHSVSPQDVLFFDPMFEDPNRKVAPKKEMRIFRNLIGEDVDAKEYFEKLRALKPKRLVVKRPKQSRRLSEDEPLSFIGKATRYDVYLNP